jgi:hypothetical protein
MFLISVGFCIVGGYVSSKYLGPNNIIENKFENMAESTTEKELMLPAGSLKKEADYVFHKPI